MKTIETIVITGASSGIGYDIARGFYTQGANLVLNARDEKKLQRAAHSLGEPHRIGVVPGDIGVKATGARLAQTALQRFGCIDVLVNNAGTFGIKPFLENTEKDLVHYIGGNLKGTYFVSQTAVAAMRRQGYGSIINVGTVLIDHPSAAIPASAALVSKGGVHALTRCMATSMSTS